MLYDCLQQKFRWLKDFLVLLICGFHPARKLFRRFENCEDASQSVVTCLEAYQSCGRLPAAAQLYDLISQCNSSSLSAITNDDGYNLLQLAVQKGDIPFVTYLLREKGCNPNKAKCSLPLHIAIQMGSMSMLRLLLAHKAKSQQTGGMCYPEPHIPSHSSHSTFFFVDRSMICGGVALDSYQRAIMLDSVPMLNALLMHRSCWQQKKVLLHYASQVGAMQCITHLVEHWGCNSNVTDNRGFSPVMYAVAGRLDAVQYLVKQNFDVNALTYQSQNVLHRLYTTDECVTDLYKKTSLFLALGADMLVNSEDVFRNTPLHYLVRRYCSAQHTSEDAGEMIASLGLLFHHNADPLLADCESCLPLLCVLQCHTKERLNQSGQLHSILQLLCKWCVEAVRMPLDSQKKTAIYYITEMCQLTGSLTYMQSIHLLQSYGVNINQPSLCLEKSVSKSCLLSVCTLVSTLASYASGVMESTENRSESAGSKQEFVQPLMVALFKAKLNPNGEVRECRTMCQSSNTNALSAFVQLINKAQNAQQLRLVRNWIKVILQWGGNPDLEAYKPDPMICTSQAGIFLRKGSTHCLRQCIQDITDQPWLQTQDAVCEIVVMLINSMSHGSLHECLHGNHTIFPTRKDNFIFNFIRDATTQPRTLKQLTRVSIYKALDRQLAQRTGELAIPNSLKHYLIDVELR